VYAGGELLLSGEFIGWSGSIFSGAGKSRGGRTSSKLAADVVVPDALRKYEQDSGAPAMQLAKVV
jgi:hypothetical protein